jgi:hypothetical protein
LVKAAGDKMAGVEGLSNDMEIMLKNFDESIQEEAEKAKK